MSDITIYTKPGCPYCAAAKDDLQRRGVHGGCRYKRGSMRMVAPRWVLTAIEEFNSEPWIAHTNGMYHCIQDSLILESPCAKRPLGYQWPLCLPGIRHEEARAT